MKIPKGKIPLNEAFQKYLASTRPGVRPLDPVSPIDQHAVDDAASKLRTAFELGELVAEVCIGSKEFRLTSSQWRAAQFPERPFFGGHLSDLKGPLANYWGYVPYTDEAILDRWILGQGSDSLAGAESRCRAWLIELMRNGPPTESKGHYCNQAQTEFGVSVRGFRFRIWPAAVAEFGQQRLEETRAAPQEIITAYRYANAACTSFSSLGFSYVAR